MLSARHFYGSNIEFLRRNERGGNYMPLSQGTHFHEQYETNAHLRERTTPSSEPDSRGTPTPRKRVPVACERCRKRKIKCSGNEGESGSCVNCKNAGQSEQCKFMRVQSYEAAALHLRTWPAQQQQHHHRYSPYSHPLRYTPVPAARYSPSNSMPFPSVNSPVDYGGYGASSPNVEWSRAPFVNQYAPFGEEDDSNLYSTQPPPYILPNTDPMTISASSACYANSYVVRQQSGSLWPDTQQPLSQQGSQMSNQTYAVPTDASQSPLQALGITSNRTAERTLPAPTVRASAYMPAPVTNIDATLLTSSTDRQSTSWSHDTSTTPPVLSSQVETANGQDHVSERRSAAYRLQELAYGHIPMCDDMSATGLQSHTPGTLHEETNPSVEPPTQGSSRTCRRTFSHDSPRSGTDNVTASYGYTNGLAGRNLQVRSSSGHLSNGVLYCRTQPPVSRRESAPGDCSPGTVTSVDCSNCPTESARSSVTSISNSSSGY
ncbi:hypothetical protein B0A52_04123 [Exophiala mesophila]|uniref:Zn(2)-C6 fungal-type domain-containing protein n=1 Tax=Exophiala mesophila TaxID=212818 RepID=A0A438NAQ3_EXOME|nr:hypothetical protein B0A52_04123 [Exophiala mesophila]